MSTPVPIVTPKGHGLGWLGVHPDAPAREVWQPATVTLPAEVDLSAECGPVLNQLNEGSCTAHAGVVHARQVYTRDGWHNPFTGAPRLLYYDERRILAGPPYNVANALTTDTGGYSQLVVQALAEWGIAAEQWCPYAPDGNPLDYLAIAPDAQTYANAYKHRATQDLALPQTAIALQSSLAAGFSFIFGFEVYASFESAAVQQTGMVPMPQPNEPVLGGHEMVAIGYRMVNGQVYVLCRNSWGPYFGLGGDVLMPMAYLLSPNLTSELWSLRVQY